MTSPLGAVEWEQNTPYYEDDGWLDISEWFDGNDYNPTDEATWRWDDETYNLAQDVGTDTDNDTWYGYTARNDDDWFYDYYDPSWYYSFDDDTIYQYGTRYFDYDNDGAYDASATYADWNGDGIFEDYDYFSFSTATDQKKRSERLKNQLPTESRRQAVTGTIQNIKQVQVRGARHTVVQVKGQGQPQQQGQAQPQDQMLLVDLGKESDLTSLNLKQGDTITAHGPRSRVGDKSIVLAKSLEVNGKTRQIERQRREISGKVVSTHKTKVHGVENLFAIVEVSASQAAGSAPQAGTGKTTAQGQPDTQPKTAGAGTPPSATKGNRVAVDLGPAARLGMNVTQGMTLEFTAVPVKVKDRRLLLAQTVDHNGRKVTIDRRVSRDQHASARVGAAAQQKPSAQTNP